MAGIQYFEEGGYIEDDGKFLKEIQELYEKHDKTAYLIEVKQRDQKANKKYRVLYPIDKTEEGSN